MLKIRLSRAGRKHLPFYRIVLTEHTKAAKHGYNEVLGFYNPISKEFSLDTEKAKKYISTGAQYSDTVAKLVAKFAA
ncbi:MAG: 30S ribosomal protein S16 [Candidatus Gracilibacteria bacterium]